MPRTRRCSPRIVEHLSALGPGFHLAPPEAFPSGTPPTPSGAPCPCSMLSMSEDGVQNQTKTSQYIQFLKNQNVKTFKRGVVVYTGFPGGSDGEESACNAGDPSLIPGSGRPSEEENGNPLQYSYLENPTGTGPWWAAIHGIPGVGLDFVTHTGSS